MTKKHKWTFKSRFRREAYSWKSTQLASKRMREAVSEIKKIAKSDSALGGEGVIELFVRLYPALMHIDSSSGALGTALNKTIDSLMPFLIKAEWDMNTRGEHLEKLYEAIIEDGWGTFDGLRDYWGEMCVYPGLAHLWADRFIDDARDVLRSTHRYSCCVDMCLSCLVYTERYQELKELLELEERPLWTYQKFWAMALVKQGKPQEALDYAQYVLSQERTDNSKPQIDRFCESVLIDMGKIDEAYKNYGLKIQSYGTYISIYKGICKKYPTKDKKQVLIDLLEHTGRKGKWFAAAKDAGYLDIALDCATAYDSEPSTLLRATRDFAEKEPEFAIKVGVEAIKGLLTETFYDPIEPIDIIQAYNALITAGSKTNNEGMVKQELSKMVLKCSRNSNQKLCGVILSEIRR